MKYLEAFLSELVQRVNLSAINLHEMLSQVQNAHVEDDVYSNPTIVQQSSPIPINQPPPVENQEELQIVGRPDEKRILYAIH